MSDARETSARVGSGSPAARIVIESRRRWFGDPRFGTFVVSLDRARAGTLPPTGRLELPCQAGDHVVRIRQWSYRSPALRLTTSSGQTVYLSTDHVRGPILKGLAIFAVAPWRALTLTERLHSAA